MMIRFTKGRLGKHDTLTCVRTDGSLTWEPSSVGVKHDLIHYAVETTLGYTHAFYGLVAQGRDIASFGTQNGQKDAYPDEALWAESIVGLFQWPSLGGGPELSEEEFRTLLAQTCTQAGRPVPSVASERRERIRALVQRLHREWEQLDAGETLELQFPQSWKGR